MSEFMVLTGCHLRRLLRWKPAVFILLVLMVWLSWSYTPAGWGITFGNILLFMLAAITCSLQAFSDRRNGFLEGLSSTGLPASLIVAGRVGAFTVTFFALYVVRSLIFYIL